MFLSIQNLLFRNLNVKQTLLKNTFWLGLGTAFTKLLFLALTIYATRILGVEGFGQFSFALAFVSLFVIFSNMGISSMIVREFAHEKEHPEQLYSLISLRIVLVLGTLLLIGISSFFIAQTPDVQMIIFILALFVVINSIIDIFYSFFHARQKMEYEAWFEAAQALAIFGLGAFMLLRFSSPLYFSYGYVLSAMVTLVLVLLFFHWKVLPLAIRWDFGVWKKFLKMSWPLAFMGMFGAVYSYTDSVMLGYLGMVKETGWYNAAFRIVMVSLVPAGFIGASFYPALSRFLAESREKFQKVWNYEIEIMIVLAVPLVVGGITLGGKMIESFYPTDFMPSILAFQILIVQAGLIFLHRPLYDAMIVLNQQKKAFWITMAGAMVNVLLNFILIPRYSLYGAACATVATHFLTLIIAAFFLRRFTFLHFTLAKIGLIAAIASIATAIMYGVITYPAFENFHIFFVVFLGAAVYFSVFLLIRKYILLTYFKKVYVSK